MMYFQLLFLNGKSSSTNQLSVCVNHPKTLFTPTFSYEEAFGRESGKVYLNGTLCNTNLLRNPYS
jgi:hypothetical protein